MDNKQRMEELKRKQQEGQGLSQDEQQELVQLQSDQSVSPDNKIGDDQSEA